MVPELRNMGPLDESISPGVVSNSFPIFVLSFVRVFDYSFLPPRGMSRTDIVIFEH